MDDRYPMVRQLECHSCRTMTEHEAVDVDQPPYKTNLLYGWYRCRECRGREVGETMTPNDHAALRAALGKEA